MYKLTKAEEKVLTLLERDCRMPASLIARKTRLSPEGVIKIINRLEEEGIISKFNAKINYYAMGYEVFPVHLKLNRMDKEIVSKIQSMLSKNFTWHCFCEGEYDLMLSFKIPKAESKERMETILNELSSFIQEKEINVVLEAFEISKSFDGSKSNDITHTYNNKFETINLSESDISAIETIKDDSRQNIISLSKKMKATSRVAALKLRRLQDQKVITGFKTKINMSQLGYHPYIALISFDNYTEKDLSRFITYCKMKEGINYLVREIGKYDIELNINTRTINEFYNLIDDIRQTFNFVKKVTTLIIKEPAVF
jgi:DNA-binding Lrp family transcriptional regulator